MPSYCLVDFLLARLLLRIDQTHMIIHGTARDVTSCVWGIYWEEWDRPLSVFYSFRSINNQDGPLSVLV